MKLLLGLLVLISSNTWGADINQAEFDQIIEKIASMYKKQASDYGATLKVKKDWDNESLNPHIHREGNTWKVHITGGLARHEMMTKDAFRLIVCHEMGHFFGGAPKWISQPWLTGEGQSDYFASVKCMRQYFHESQNWGYDFEIDSYLKEKCQESFSHSHDLEVCYRTGMAGLSLARFANRNNSRKPVDFKTPSTRRVSRTTVTHPPAQCRLDTILAGALCPVDWFDQISDSDPKQGVCSRHAGNSVGYRPLCWFKP